MTAHSPQAWLPPSALNAGTAETALGERVEQWSRRWIVGAPLRLIGAAGKGPLRIPANDSEQWFGLEEGLFIGVGAVGEAALAAAILDLGKADRPSTPADAEVIALLAAACLGDLRDRLAQLLQLRPEQGWGQVDASAQLPEGYACAIGTSEGQPILRLFLSQECFVALVKISSAPPPPPAPLRPMDEALSLQEIDLAALVGTCELPLSELAGLAAGDVVVLDRDLAETLPIALSGAPRGGRCSVAQDGERLLLNILEPPVQVQS